MAGEVRPNSGHKDRDNMRAVYDQLCQSYRAIDGLRGTLLGALPLVSGGGIFVLATAKVDDSIYFPIGVFGALVTVGLFIFEIYATNRCTELIKHGRVLEDKDHLGVEGQFTKRPDGVCGFDLIPEGNGATGWLRVPLESKITRWFRDSFKSIAPFISEPMASGIIYPAVLGGWIFLALFKASVGVAGFLGIMVFVLGFLASFQCNLWLAEKLRGGGTP